MAGKKGMKQFCTTIIDEVVTMKKAGKTRSKTAKSVITN